MNQQFIIIQRPKQKLSAKQIPSLGILKLNQEDLESYVKNSLVDNPFSDVDQSKMSFDIKEVDYKTIRKKNDEIQDFEIEDDNQNDLVEYVMPQLREYIKNDKDEKIFRILLESLDSRGFFNGSLESLSNFLHVPVKRIEKYLSILGRLDPKGLGTKDIKDCLMNQLSDIENSYLAQRLILSHLVSVRQGDYIKIANIEKTSVESVKDALKLIQSLNPIPANGFKVDSKTVYIIPDVYISKDESEMHIELNQRIQDKLVLNVHNYELYKSSEFDDETYKFLKGKLNDFKWLQYSINRRTLTIKKIITFLVDYQVSFFQTGNIQELKPIRLTDIADKIELHPSTISRAVSNKYFRCDYGIFPFQFLIPRSYGKKGEDLVSIDTIKEEIQEIIKLEDQSHPYSDKKIHELLEEEGYCVSRRTVTLYRNECYIPSSRNRRMTYQQEKRTNK